MSADSKRKKQQRCRGSGKKERKITLSEDSFYRLKEHKYGTWDTFANEMLESWLIINNVIEDQDEDR